MKFATPVVLRMSVKCRIVNIPYSGNANHYYPTTGSPQDCSSNGGNHHVASLPTLQIYEDYFIIES